MSYSATAHPADLLFMTRRMSTIDVVRIEKSTRTDRASDVVRPSSNLELVTEPDRTHDADPPFAEEVHETRQQHRNQSIKNTLMFRIMPACFLLMIAAHMHPGGSGGGRRSGRSDPPAWNPDSEASYPFQTLDARSVGVDYCCFGSGCITTMRGDHSATWRTSPRSCSTHVLCRHKHRRTSGRPTS